MFKVSERDEDLSQMEAALKYSTAAVQQLPADAKVKEHHAQVTDKVE